MNQFDPEHLGPDASINRVAVTTDDGERYVTAYDLLSTQALSNLIRGQCTELGFSPSADWASVIAAFDDYLGPPSESPEAEIALKVAETFSLRLGRLIQTLTAGPLAARLARPDWNSSHWKRWSEIEVVLLGGGLMSGNLGRYVDRRLPGLLREMGVESCTANVAEYAQWLPLIGASRSASGATPRAVTLDFGQTFIKRGIAAYKDGELAQLLILQPIGASQVGSEGRVEDLGKAIVSALVETVSEATARGSGAATEIVCSVACYLQAGQPHPNATGAYARLRELGPNLAEWLGAQVSRELRAATEVRLIHDGTAAGRSYRGSADASVLTFGSAIGVGFPSSQNLVRIAPAFVIDESVQPHLDD